MIDVSEASFSEQVLESDNLVLAEFWSSWCPPCKIMEPTLKELETDYPQVTICKINTDRNRSLTKKYEIRGVPTFLFFKKGELLHREVSAKSKNQLIKIIEELK
ncbi:MAG: thioredoxin [Candidatus Altiarchaeales archaeon ex4484_96]|nr:MAG: thioredoxin [Candidatus Altiarchaeales archaeon ex4484_96]